MRSPKLLLCIILLGSCFAGRVCVAQNPSWVVFPYNDSVERKCLTFDGSGQLWSANISEAYSGGQVSGVARFDGTKWHNFGKADGLLYDTVNAMTRDRQGRIWTAGKHGVCYFDNESGWHALAVQDSFTANREYLSIVCDSSGNIWTSSWTLVFKYWAGTTPDYWAYSQIHKWDGHTWTTYDFTSEDSSHQGVQTAFMTVAPNGTLWGVYIQLSDRTTNQFYGGLRKFDGSKWSIDTLGGRTLPKFRQPAAIECDKYNNVWIGYTFNQVPAALEMFDGNSWTEYSSAGFQYGLLGSMKFDHQNRLWIGGQFPTTLRGIIEFDGTTILHNYNDSNSALLGETVYSLAFDNSGDAWVASEVGLSELQGAASVSEHSSTSSSFLSVYPNPASNVATIEYSFQHSSKARLSIYDILGREVQAQVIEPSSGTARQHVVINTIGLQSGHYFLSVSSEGQSVTRELVIER